MPSGGHRYRPATVRFYFDADVLGLAKILAQMRSDVTYPGDPGGELFKRHRGPCPITSTAVTDSEWIPEVTRQGWLIITRDASDSRPKLNANGRRSAPILPTTCSHGIAEPSSPLCVRSWSTGTLCSTHSPA